MLAINPVSAEEQHLVGYTRLMNAQDEVFVPGRGYCFRYGHFYANERYRHFYVAGDLVIRDSTLGFMQYRLGDRLPISALDSEANQRLHGVDFIPPPDVVESYAPYAKFKTEEEDWTGGPCDFPPPRFGPLH